MTRLPEPSPPDVCGGCGRDRPLYRLYGRGEDHVHRCGDCLRDAFAGQLVDDPNDPAAVTRESDLRRDRDEARSWARKLWVLAGEPWLRNHPEMGPPPGWLAIPGETAAEGHDRRLAERIGTLEEELAAAVRGRDEVGASLRTAEEVVVRQKTLLETAIEMIEEARRWARSLWDDGPASEEPVVLNEPEFAPAWLTADDPRHTARPPRPPEGLDQAAAAHELRLAALDRLIADVEAEWGPFSAEEMATAAQRLRGRAHG